MKTIILNASPRKNWNTAQMLHAAMDGAKAAGSEVTYVDLYDLNFTGCRSCLACKRKGAAPGKCYWKDDLSPLIDQIFASDNLIIGSPLYYGATTSQFHALSERLNFCVLSYNDFSCSFKGNLNVGIVLTMNAPKEYFEKQLLGQLQQQFQWFKLFGGQVELCNSYDTLQVDDYSKYEMAGWNEAAKKERRATVFPEELQAAFDLGRRFGAGS